MKVYGYCRISTAHQNIDRQERNIRELFPQADIRKEVYTGTKLQGRTELDKILRQVRSGDVIVFDSVSRMSRDAEEGVNLYFRLFNDGVDLVFLKERTIDTEAYRRAVDGLSFRLDVSTGDSDADAFLSDMMAAVGRYISRLAEKQIRLAFEQAQKEVDDLHQRTREGIKTARLNGKQIGQAHGKRLNVKKEQPIKAIILSKSKTFGKGNNTDAEVIAIINGTEAVLNPKKGKEPLHISRKTYYEYKRELLAEMNKSEINFNFMGNVV